jgi:hypothetical protein
LQPLSEPQIGRRTLDITSSTGGALSSKAA